MQGSHTSTDRPLLACEISEDRVIAARVAGSGGALEAHTSRRLATGTLATGLTDKNIERQQALGEALQSALGDVAGKNRDVIAILPDASIRVVLLDFDSLPDDKDEARSIIRFRVRKTVPFNVDEAAVSYDIQPNGGSWRVIASLVPKSILHEYEDVFQLAGFSVGVAVPSIIATLGLVDVVEPTLLVKVDPTTCTLVLIHKNALLQIRTVEFPASEHNAKQLADQVFPSLVFHEDTYNSKVERVLLTGISIAPGLGAALQQECGVAVEEVAASGVTGTSFGEPMSPAMLTSVLGVFQA